MSDFIKGTRKLPFGNFISFPAEIMRTSANIVQRALKEINYTQVVDGKTIKPLEGIGLTRLFGFGATTLAVPYAAVESAKALYNVTEEEMPALLASLETDDKLKEAVIEVNSIEDLKKLAT